MKTFLITPHVGVRFLLKNLLNIITKLDDPGPLNALDGDPCLPDIYPLLRQFRRDVNSEALSILFNNLIDRLEDEESIWSANYGLPTLERVPREKSISPLMARDPVALVLYDAWCWPYLTNRYILLAEFSVYHP